MIINRYGKPPPFKPWAYKSSSACFGGLIYTGSYTCEDLYKDDILG